MMLYYRVTLQKLSVIFQQLMPFGVVEPAIQTGVLPALSSC